MKIVIKDFNFYYNEKQVIHNLNLSIAPYEITSIFGPANSGITTLLRAFNRMCDLTQGAKWSGEILLDGKNIFDPDVNVTELRRKVGMVFEVPAPLPLSVFDNIAYGPRLSGIRNKKIIRETVEEALRLAALWDDVKDRLDVSGTMLSGGQQQRLCIARVLALKPEVLVMDRCCSGLDPISTAKIEESLRTLSERFTIVLAPHNVQQAGRSSDRVAFMLMGHLIEEGRTTDVFADPKDQRTSDYITGRYG